MHFNRKNIRSYLSAKWSRVRFLCYPLLVVIAIRVIASVWFYHLMLSQDREFHFAWLDANPKLLPATSKWLFLFNAGDSFRFPYIAMFGYSHPIYVFLPGYPILIRFAGLLVGDYWFGAFLVTQAFALASIVVFQLLAELYTQPREALYATLLMATFPYISVFTTLGYSEAVFLFATIATWYFYKKGRIATSSLLAGLASVTRIYGFAIALPMFLDIVNSKQYRKLFYVAIPAVFVGLWVLFCYLSAGDPFASWTDEYTTFYVAGTNLGFAQTILFQLTHGLPNAGFDPAILVSVALFALIVVKTWQVDHYLWTYTVTLLASLIFAVTSHITLLRYLSFIFPIWLTVKVRNPVVVGICVALFVPVLLLMWLYAITIFFVG